MWVIGANALVWALMATAARVLFDCCKLGLHSTSDLPKCHSAVTASAYTAPAHAFEPFGAAWRLLGLARTAPAHASEPFGATWRLLGLARTAPAHAFERFCAAWRLLGLARTVRVTCPCVMPRLGPLGHDACTFHGLGACLASAHEPLRLLGHPTLALATQHWCEGHLHHQGTGWVGARRALCTRSRGPRRARQPGRTWGDTIAYACSTDTSLLSSALQLRMNSCGV